MKEAIGNTFVFNFVITFVAIFIFFFVGTMSYTKAFKVKNKIVDLIESYDGEISSENNNKLNDKFESKVNEKLSEIGYTISTNNTCDTDGRFSDGVSLIKSGSSTYRYCIYKFSTSKGNYYGVVSYIYFEVPIIGSKLEFPVYGETKVFTEISKG